MSIRVRQLVERLREEAKKDENVGTIGLLLEEAAQVIANQQDDLAALRNHGSDYA